MGNKLIAGLQLRFKAVGCILAPGAIARDILYTWVEDGKEQCACTRTRGSPGMPAQERQAFLVRNNYKEWDRG